MSFDPGFQKKYRRIYAQPHLDGIFASGLISRLFNVPIRFKLLLRGAENSIIIGMPISNGAHIIQSFIIDIINCEKFLRETMTTNFMLCNDNYGSLTDFVVDVFDFDVPEDILDAIYRIAVRDVQEDTLAEKFLVSWLMAPGRDVWRKLAILIRKNSWSAIVDWAHRNASTMYAKHIVDLSQKLESRCQVLLRGVAMVRFSVRNKMEKLAARLTLHRASNISPVFISIGSENSNAKICFVQSQRYDLMLLSNFFVNLGYTVVARPNIVRIYVDENIQQFLDKLILAVRSSYKRIK